ncbi:MAG: hypothetical protein ACKOCX_00465 [Planctomycetota bacterium]
MATLIPECASRFGELPSETLAPIRIDSPDTSRQRVAMRVMQGGHDVPDEKLAAQFQRTLANLERAITMLPVVIVFDNTDLARPFQLAAVSKNGTQIGWANRTAPSKPLRDRPMALTGVAEWKEIIVVSDEEGRTYVVNCGWGVEPPVAYIPAAAMWRAKVPAWLHDRRDEVITVLESLHHVVEEETF